MEYITERTFEGQTFNEKPLKKGEYELCVFRNCDFSGADLEDLRFLESEFEDCNLSNADLHNVSFQDTRFSNCKMLGLQFQVCNDLNFSVHFEDCILDHSIFYRMKLNNSSFQACQLHGADFAEAEMHKTPLQKCDLLNAGFDRTDLSGADLRNSINYSIDPENTKVKGAKFSLPEALRLLDKYGIKIG